MMTLVPVMKDLKRVLKRDFFFSVLLDQPVFSSIIRHLWRHSTIIKGFWEPVAVVGQKYNPACD